MQYGASQYFAVPDHVGGHSEHQRWNTEMQQGMRPFAFMNEILCDSTDYCSNGKEDHVPWQAIVAMGDSLHEVQFYPDKAVFFSMPRTIVLNICKQLDNILCTLVTL